MLNMCTILCVGLQSGCVQMNAERIVCLQAWLLIIALHLSTA